MTITISEALRLKNELSTIVKGLTYSLLTSSLGQTHENGVLVSRDISKFTDVEPILIKALVYSYEINNGISHFNRINGIDSKVRAMQNHRLLLDIYIKSLQKTKPTKDVRFENLNSVREKIDIIYSPDFSAKEMKEKIAEEKKNVRKLQSEIELLNQSQIKLSFSEKDIDDLTL